MKFKIIKKDTVIWPVTVNIPADGGGTEKHSFYARFRRLKEHEFDFAAKEGQTALLKKIIVAVGEDEGELEDVSAEELQGILTDTNYRVGFYNAYLRMDAGVEEKNS